METWLETEDAYLRHLTKIAQQNGTDSLLGAVVRLPRGDAYVTYMVWQTKPQRLVRVVYPPRQFIKYVVPSRTIYVPVKSTDE